MTIQHYKFKYGNKYFKEFQDYFYDTLSRRDRMTFKRINNIRGENGYLLNNITFLRYVRDRIEKNYEDYFKFIIKKNEDIPTNFILYFD